MDISELRALLWDFAGHRVVTVASRAGILSRLAEGSGTADEVAADLSLDPLATGKVIRALNALGLLEAQGTVYRVVDTLAPCFRPGPDDLTAYLEHAHHLYDRWGATLESWLRGEPAPPRRRTAEQEAAFAAAMQAMGAHVARKVVSALDLTGVRRVLDVGGSLGHYAAAVCRAVPGATATVLDRPGVVAIGWEAMAGTDLESRITFVEGDYLGTDYGEGFDLVLLANILHQESAERAAELVRRSASALARSGRVAVVDFAIDPEQRTHVLGALFAINMRSFGDTHTEPTIRRWLAESGLVDLERVDLDDARWVITGRKPG